ncbi:MAG: butyrate kinase, partial [Eubacteriales bacterium]|nr:butyrate kinase [Eubacteriales bacterium]
MEKVYKIIAVNPGSTSTKVAVFNNEDQIFSVSIPHTTEELADFKEIIDQLDYRKKKILDALEKGGISLNDVSAYSGRGGSLEAVESGTYIVDDLVLKHAADGHLVKHPAMLGSILAHELAEISKAPAYVVNSPDTDEFQDVARITGLRGIYRESRTHALSQKEVGLQYAASIGRNYRDLNLIITHMGGGISVVAHRHGRMIDSNDVVNGEGPMAP